MDNQDPTPMYQQQTPIEIIGLCSDVATNKARKIPQKVLAVLTCEVTRQNRFGGAS